MPEDSPTAAEVVGRLYNEVDPELGTPERIELLQVNPHEYTYRVYVSGSIDYEGGVIQLTD